MIKQFSDMKMKRLNIVFMFKYMFCNTLLHYGSLPFTSVVGSESRPSSRGIFVT